MTASNALFTGKVVADSFSDKMVIVESGNKALYFANTMNASGHRVRLIYDGSGGGEIIRTMQLNVPPYNTATSQVEQISMVTVGTTQANISTEVNLIINCTGVLLDDDDISGWGGGGAS